MAITLELRQGSLWGVARGPNADLVVLQHTLDAWVGQLAGGGGSSGLRVWTQKRSGEMGVLAGALLALAGQLPGIEGPVYLGQSPNVDAAIGTLQYLEAEGMLRPYQTEAALAAISAPLGRALLSVAPGGGKTRIVAGLAMALGSAGYGRVLYLCHSPQLVRQAEAALRKDIEAISSRLRGVPVELITGTYSSVRVPIDVDVLIVDECHRAGSATGMRALASVEAVWRIGMSGTPLDRTDGGNALVVGLLGPCVYHLGIDELTRMGYLTPGMIQ